MLERLLQYRRDRYLKKCIQRGLIIGKSCVVLDGVSFDDTNYAFLIQLGDCVTVGRNVRFLAHDASMRRSLGIVKIGLIRVGSHVFIGENSIILPGVEIGEYTVIGAGSVVSSNVPARSVFAGSPAKYICSYDDFMKRHDMAFEKQPVFEISKWDFSTISPEEREKVKNALRNGMGYLKMKDRK